MHVFFIPQHRSSVYLRSVKSTWPSVVSSKVVLTPTYSKAGSISKEYKFVDEIFGRENLRRRFQCIKEKY